MSNEAVAEFLERVAQLLELKGENPFKIRSYRNAAATLVELGADVEDLLRQGELIRVKGIGKGISESIGEFIERGSAAILDHLEAEVPEGLLEMTAIRGLGPKKIRALHEKLGVTSLGELEYACVENRLLDLKGFGAKTQAGILKEILAYKRYASLFHLHYAHLALADAAAYLRNVPEVEAAEIAGEARRFMEVVAAGALVAATDSPDRVFERLASQAAFAKHARREGNRLWLQHEHGLPLEVHAAPPPEFAARLLHATGAPEHLRMLADHARKKGFRLEEQGLFQGKSEKPLDLPDEAALYGALELAFIPPELREGAGEIEAASEGRLPALVEDEDIQGIVHVHTTYSDGTRGLEEMAEAVKARGYRYIGIADHSRSAAYAGGLSIERLAAQGEEIRGLNRKWKDFRILHGVESDILKDGSLDYPDDVLERLDFVIASVHSGFRMDRDAMTRRIQAAVRHPCTRILGHPTGRLLLGREPYEVDLDAVLGACAERGVIVELNASPHRLDVDWRRHKACTRLGLKIMINPDAHGIEGLDDIRFGVGVARKGWLTRDDVANTLPADELHELWRRGDAP